MKLLPHAAWSLALALAACATTEYHYSWIEGTKYDKAAMNTYPLQIVAIDGKSPFDRRAQVDPGLRHLVVSAPGGPAVKGSNEITYDLNVAPCTHYYLVAVKDSPLLPEFIVRIDHQEPVPGCTPPPPK